MINRLDRKWYEPEKSNAGAVSNVSFCGKSRKQFEELLDKEITELQKNSTNKFCRDRIITEKYSEDKQRTCYKKNAYINYQITSSSSFHESVIHIRKNDNQFRKLQIELIDKILECIYVRVSSTGKNQAYLRVNMGSIGRVHFFISAHSINEVSLFIVVESPSAKEIIETCHDELLMKLEKKGIRCRTYLILKNHAEEEHEL